MREAIALYELDNLEKYTTLKSYSNPTCIYAPTSADLQNSWSSEDKKNDEVGTYLIATPI